MLFVGVLIFIQMIVRLRGNSDFSILGNHQMEVIIAGVILQAFGIVAIITKSIWNDTNYKDILRDDHIRNKDKKNK